MGGFFGAIRESFAGAWQKNVVAESRTNILAFSAVFSCISRIADDIAKLCLQIVEKDDDGIWSEIDYSNSPFEPVIQSPNSYQTLPQFLTYWIMMRLMYGNVYVLKEFDQRGIVTAMHVMDSRFCVPLIGPDGSVFYDLKRDDLNQSTDGVVPQRFVMHDRMNTFWHPLVGVSPVYACGASATQGIRIQNNSATFFENMSRPSGMLTAPATIDDITSARIKREFEGKFSGGGLGGLFVAGDGLEYEAFTMPAVEAQLIEQLRWTVEDVARCFHVPLHKIGAGVMPTFTNISALNLDYYEQTLHPPMRAIECLLTEGLNLDGVAGRTMAVRFDITGLLRMDQQGTATYLKDMVSGGILSPNDARAVVNYKPVDGGDSPMIQQQNYSLAALAKRDAAAPAPGTSVTPAIGTPFPGTPVVPPDMSTDTPPVNPGASKQQLEYEQRIDDGLVMMAFAGEFARELACG